jgi:hypothetical protein
MDFIILAAKKPGNRTTVSLTPAPRGGYHSPVMSRLRTFTALAVLLLVTGCTAQDSSLARLATGVYTPDAAPEGTAVSTGADPVMLAPHTPVPGDVTFSLGESIEGRPIEGWRFGEGPRRIVLIGAIHGGFERNTAVLADLLVDHFRDHPEDVLPGIQLEIIPVANPDGLARGSDLNARFNANDVDLNRNWSCEWSETALLQEIPIDPGPAPFSEVESQLLRDYFLADLPDAVMFYHSSVGGVFMGACGADHPPADWMGELLEEATGYPYHEFDYYDITGDATNWLAEQDVPAATIELYTDTEPEFSRNLAGVLALSCHFALADGAEGEDIDRLCR